MLLFFPYSLIYVSADFWKTLEKLWYFFENCYKSLHKTPKISKNFSAKQFIKIKIYSII